MLRRLFSVAAFAVLFAVAGYLMSPAPTATAAQKGKNEKGRQLYMAYCASCHGVDGKGNGPAAPALKTAPADLTNIPKDNGKFPALRVKRIISGDDVILGHGSREMPIWGRIFSEQRERTIAATNIYALTMYVQSIQAR